MHAAFVLPDPDDAGPGADYVRHLAPALRDLGFAASVLAVSDAPGAAWRAVPDDAVPVIDGMALPHFLPLRDELAARGTVALVHHPGAPTPPGDSADRDGAAREAVRDAMRRVLPALRRVVATGAPVAERLVAEFGVARDRVATVAPGVPDLPRGAGSGGAGCAVLSVGVLAPRKGHDVLLRALSRLPDLDWTLRIAGDARRDPAHAAGLAALVAASGLADRVAIVPDPDAAALDALWRGADVFALATRWESYAASVAQALRRGLPVAVMQGGAAADLVTPACAVVCPVGDVQGLSKAMRRLIFDAGLRAEMAEAAWRVGRALPGWPEQAVLFARAVAPG